MVISGEIIKGHQIASGLSKEGHNGLNNTIALQRPYFEKEVPGFDALFDGTLNVSIAPKTVEILKPDFEVTCQWHPGVTETFWLVASTITFKKKTFAGFIYYPLPSNIKSHPNTMIELLAPKITTIHYGDTLQIEIPEGKIKLI